MPAAGHQRLAERAWKNSVTLWRKPIVARNDRGLEQTQTEGVIEQFVVSALQMVGLLPGARGAKEMVAPLETAAESIVPVIELQALFGADGKPEKLATAATTAWFMYALASILQAPSAARMR